MQRMTKQRQAVLTELERIVDFRSAQQVHEDLVAQGHRVGLATVYRNLQNLTDSGRLDVLRSADGESLYRLCGDLDHHHHLVCRNCGHAEEIAMDHVEAWVAQIAASHGYSDVEHSVEIFGLCSPCASDLEPKEAISGS
ncbi:MAG: Fur family transcriptional regulator [Actinomycetaceae bacterium]|nr:Fur family transcriptional regulator [Actinomycetaceae bacterium]